MSDNKENLAKNDKRQRKQSDKTRFFLASIVESLEDSVVSVDFNTIITSWNKGAEKLYGYSAEEVVGQPLTMLTLPEDLEQLLANIESIRSGGIVNVYETEWVHKDGGRLHLSITMSPVTDDRGQIIGVSTIARNIGKRKTAEESSRIAHERISNILESTTDCFFALDAERRFTYVNSQTEAYFGIPREQMLGRSFVEVLPKLKGHEILQRQEEAMTSGIPIHFETRSPATGKWVELHFYPNSEGLAVYFRDITDRKQTEEKLKLLVTLNQELLPLTEPDEIKSVTARMLGEHLQANRCAYAEVEADEDSFRITGDYLRGTFSIVGDFKMSTFGAEALRLMRQNQLFVVDDVEQDPRTKKNLKAYRQTDIAAVISVPLHKEGRLVAGMAVHQTAPRKWTKEEIELVQMVVSRCWESIERARTVRNLLQSEERFRALVGQATAGISQGDEAGRLTFVNDRFCEITGYSREELLNMRVQDITDPEVIAANLELYQRIWRDGTPFTIEKQYIRKDGTRVWVNNSVAPVVGASGRTESTACVTIDITKRKQAEEARGLLASIVASSDDAIVVVNLERKIISWNPAAERMFGYTAEEIIGQPISIIVPEEKRGESEANYLRFTKGERTPIDTVRRRKDGTLVDVSLLLSYVQDGQNKTIGISAILRDITARKLAEAKIRRQAQIIDLSCEPMFIWNVEKGITDWNRGSEQLYGYSHAEALGKVSHELLKTIFPFDVDTLLSVLRREGTWIGKLRHQTRDGREVIVESRMQLVEADGLEVVLETNRDITEHEKLLQREHSARLQAEEASRLKDEFLATVSHELRTPLNAILGWSQMLTTGDFDPDSAFRAVEAIYRNAKFQAQLIEDILDVSRIITGKLRINAKPISLTPVIQNAVESLRSSIKAKNLRLHMGFAFEPRMVHADADRLQQVFWNLLSNAIKFTPERGQITIELTSREMATEIVVADTGQGIRPEFLPFVFDRFRQDDGSTTRRHGGLGLGLSIVRHIVELHGGKVEVHSAGEGKGTTFTVRLPLSETPMPSAEDTNGSDQKAGQVSPNVAEAAVQTKQIKGLRVLLVDDETDTLDLLTTALVQSGAEVKPHTNVRDALETIKVWKPDVIITDLGMPVEDGYFLIRKLRALPPDKGGTIPAVALTAYVGIKERTKVLSSGFQMYVPKPVEPSELLSTLANLI